MCRCVLLTTASLMLTPVAVLAETGGDRSSVPVQLYNTERMCDTGNDAACRRLPGRQPNTRIQSSEQPQEEPTRIVTPRPWWSDSFARMRGNNAEPNQN